jgi:hypothetical protein
MKKYLLICLIYFFLTSCREEVNQIQFSKGGMITKKGIYLCRKITILVKSFEDGSLVYAVTDKRNKIIYQQSIYLSFSDSQFWRIYVDKNSNVWFYSSDIQESNVLVKDSKSNEYIIKNFCEEVLTIPKELLKELSNKDDFCFKKLKTY